MSDTITVTFAEGADDSQVLGLGDIVPVMLCINDDDVAGLDVTFGFYVEDPALNPSAVEYALYDSSDGAAVSLTAVSADTGYALDPNLFVGVQWLILHLSDTVAAAASAVLVVREFE